MPDDHVRLLDAVRVALTQQTPFRIVGSGSKTFLSHADRTASLLSTSDHTGVIEYRPEELVITVRAGTTLAELRRITAEHGQMWACDPPEFGGRGTVGGAIASGWCGPGRPWYGSVRDSLLGIQMINGYGELLRFGGKVMKNVAGFDVSRLLAGSQGTLGVILSASLKLLPEPEVSRTIAIPCTLEESLEVIKQYARKTSGLTGTCFVRDVLYLRFSGFASAVDDEIRTCARYEEVDSQMWHEIRDQTHPFFVHDDPLWRVSYPRGTHYRDFEHLLGNEYLAEWNGSLVWLTTRSSSHPDFSVVPHSVRGFRNAKYENPTSSKYASRIKHAFDPQKIFNPGVVI